MSTAVPRVSVVLPVYNGEAYLEEAVGSILGQTLADHELIVVDDGSTDDSSHILERLATADPRVRVLRNDGNQGLIDSLNRALRHARGEYVARQDADDVSFPTRLERQVAYLDRHPEVGLLGTAYYRQGPDGRRSRRRPPTHDTEIRWKLLFGNVWCHASMMFRRALVAGEQEVYRDYLHAEDYELWVRLLRSSRGATLPEPLVVYRVREDGVCATNREDQLEMAAAVAGRQLAELLGGRLLGENEVAALRRCRAPRAWTKGDLAVSRRILDLFAAFERLPEVDARAVARLRRQWMRRALGALTAAQWPAFLFSGLAGRMAREDLTGATGALLGGLWSRARRILPAAAGGRAEWESDGA